MNNLFSFDIFIEVFKKFKYLFIPSFLLALLSEFNLLPTVVPDISIPIIAIFSILLGLPLAPALRVDQWSLYFPNLSREILLIGALFVTYFNLCILFFFKNLIFPKRNNSDSDVTETEKDESRMPKKNPKMSILKTKK